MKMLILSEKIKCNGETKLIYILLKGPCNPLESAISISLTPLRSKTRSCNMAAAGEAEPRKLLDSDEVIVTDALEGFP